MQIERVIKMAEREPIAWVTRGGKHIPIFADEPNADEKKKDKEIAKNKAEGISKNLEEKYKNINPGFKKDASNLDKEGFNNNCVKCALAFEANMRGQDTEANPFKFADSEDIDKSKKVNDAFGVKSRDVWEVGRPKKDAAIQEIELMMKEDWGDGSRAIIQEGGGGRRHTMNVINQSGDIMIVDAQSGKHGNVKQMLKGIDTKNLVMFRTDDKQISSEYSKWAYKKI